MEKMEQGRGENMTTPETFITDSIIGIFGVENSVLLVLVLKILYTVHKEIKEKKSTDDLRKLH
jgi:hypothetical protein